MAQGAAQARTRITYPKDFSETLDALVNSLDGGKWKKVIIEEGCGTNQKKHE